MIIGLGMVLNKQGIDYGFVIVQGGVGYFCIVEVCMIEIICDGKLLISFMVNGDIVCIEMFDDQ